MKLLITTRADSGVQEYADISHPIFKDYAEKVGADLRRIRQDSTSRHRSSLEPQLS